MRYSILGPLEVRDVSLGQGRQRLLLAVLLLHRNEVLSSERLIEALWGEAPPPTAAGSLHNLVSALRKALGNGALVTHGHGYALTVAPGELDADEFEALSARGRAALADGDAGEAAELLREALALWRGPALGELAYDLPAAAGRLEDLKLERDRGPDRRRPRARPPCRAGRRAGGAGRAPPGARAPARPADARAVPLRPPGRRARRLPGLPAPAGRRARARSRARAARARAGDPRARPGARRPGARAARRRGAPAAALDRRRRGGARRWPRPSPLLAARRARRTRSRCASSPTRWWSSTRPRTASPRATRSARRPPR